MHSSFISTDAIRTKFLNFFERNAFKNLESASLVPLHDSSILLVNAGMTPFKHYFLNAGDSPYSSVSTVQRCIRAGGKHNDLANVGFSDFHHTFFEMCGCFNFDGTVTRKMIMALAFQFLTKELLLNPEKLRFSYMEGDDDTKAIWKEITDLPSKHFFSDAENIWSMGNVGPFGPCTEIYYKLESGEDLEIWNIVFMTSDKKSDGTVEALPNCCIDTGMGLERIAAVCQGVNSTFDIDAMSSLKSEISQIIPCSNEVVLRVLSDHMRSLLSMIADGILPSASGRGYTFRRIARRALTFVWQYDLQAPLLPSLVDPTAKALKACYPDISNVSIRAKSILQEEEEKFFNILSVAHRFLDEGKRGSTLSGEEAFTLYSTYGLPIEVIEDTCQANGILLNLHDFQAKMKVEKAKSKSSRKSLNTAVSHITEFTGHEESSSQGKVLELYDRENLPVSRLASGTKGTIVLDRTALYPESGGQKGDRGTLKALNGSFAVETTFYEKKCILHSGYMTSGIISSGDDCTSSYDKNERNLLRRHHTATHLLHSALVELYGTEVKQMGSSVQSVKTRLDFSFNDKDVDASAIEHLVNDWIEQDLPCSIDYLDICTAKDQGIKMLEGFGYDENIRVLTVGGRVSIEACCGTHVDSTSDIGTFKIVKVSTISASVKRIEAKCSTSAIEWLRDRSSILERAALEGRCSADQLPVKLIKILEGERLLQKKIKDLQLKLFEVQVKELKHFKGVDISSFSIPEEKILCKKLMKCSNSTCYINEDGPLTSLYWINLPERVLMKKDDLQKAFNSNLKFKKNLLRVVVRKGAASVKFAVKEILS